jgi:hypothetical protein
MSGKTYQAGLTRTSWGHIYFTAGSLTEAEDLLEKVQEGTMELKDLPDFREDFDGGESIFDDVERTE